MIKICGLRTLEDITIINAHPVDYVGFVFASSKRRVTPEEARSMIKQLDRRVKAVGVFVNASPEAVNETIAFCGINIAQLHGEETPEECSRIIVPVWKAIAVKDDQAIQAGQAYRDVAGILLDGAKAGSGTVFDWSRVEGFADKQLTILAGGLNAENVQLAIKTVKPHIVDVSSGVETDGIKDRKKIISFIRKVNEYEA